MHSKQRFGKVFYLPLEYQIFLQPYTMSTAVFPYAFHHLKRTSHLANLNYHSLCNTGSLISKPFARKNTTTLKKMGEEIMFVQSITRASSNLGKRKNLTTVSLNQVDNGVQFIQSITRTSSIDNHPKMNMKSSILQKTCDDVEVVVVQNIGESSSYLVKRDKTEHGLKKQKSSDNELDHSNYNPANEAKSDPVVHDVTREEAVPDFYSEPTSGLVQYPIKYLESSSKMNNFIIGNHIGAMSDQALQNNNASSSQCSDVQINFSHNLLFGSSSHSQRNQSNASGGNTHTEDHFLRRESASNEVKIMSYNILAQTLLLRHQNLYGYLERQTAEWEVRLKNITNEILGYNCDIVCLQEVEESHLECLTSKLVNYKYVYKKRTGPTVDGCCILYKPSKYTLIKQKFVEYFKSDSHHVMNKHNIAVIVCFKSAHDYIIVANTHLLYNPRRSDIRYEQCKYLLNQICSFRDNLPKRNIPVVITGDFNSEPNAGLFNFILRHKFLKLVSAYDPKNHVVSTYHDSWCLVDYIFYTSDNLRLVDQKMLPSYGESISRIPNSIEGSDHFSLVAKFAFP